jgi:hypothetical protein
MSIKVNPKLRVKDGRLQLSCQAAPPRTTLRIRDYLLQENTERIRAALPGFTSTELERTFNGLIKEIENCQRTFTPCLPQLITSKNLSAFGEEQLSVLYRYATHPTSRRLFNLSLRYRMKNLDVFCSYWKRLQDIKKVRESQRELLENIIESGPYTVEAIRMVLVALDDDQIQVLFDLIIPMMQNSDLEDLLLYSSRVCTSWWLKPQTYDEMSPDLQYCVCRKLFTGFHSLRIMESVMKIRNPGCEVIHKARQQREMLQRSERKRDKSPKRNKLRPQLKNKTPRHTTNT